MPGDCKFFDLMCRKKKVCVLFCLVIIDLQHKLVNQLLLLQLRDYSINQILDILFRQSIWHTWNICKGRAYLYSVFQTDCNSAWFKAS